MKLSPYFAQLRSAYEAEINDMAFDSEGKNVLRQRLAQRRKELPFLRQMMASAPEMVAIVFHQGMRFGKPSAMDALVGRDASALPDWASLAASVSLEAWAEPLAQDLCKKPGGDAFMVLAAAMAPLPIRRLRHAMGRERQVLAGADLDAFVGGTGPMRDA